jgi:RHS repeat-associated protein
MWRAPQAVLSLLLGAWVAFGSGGIAHASGVDPTKISLPKGPASIEGLGRNFVPSLSSGTASYGIDIAVPPAVGGFGPRLSLDYDAGSGASEIGLGWRLGGVPSIRRRVDEGLPHFDDSDAFEVTGLGMPSDLLEVAPGVYRPQYESGAFLRVQRSDDGAHWEARTKNGFTYRFGADGYTEAEGDRVATYLLREQYDLHGHVIRYAWDTSEGHALLERVTWNETSEATRIEVVFTYEARPDVYETFSSGIRQLITRRLHQIEVMYGGDLVRRYTLEYGDGSHPQLKALRMVGTDGETALPTLTLEYTEPSFATDGQIVSMKSAPGRSPEESDAELADLNGDSLPDLLVTSPGAYRSYVNHDGTTWKAAESWAATASPSLALSTVGVQLADLDGDGAIDLVAKSGTTSFRYFPGKDATSFAPTVAIKTVPNFSFEDPDVRLGDMDGDRRTDVVVTTAAGLAIGYNVSGSDWTLPSTVGVVDADQPLRFSDGKTQLCDVNGDRLQDLCYLRSESLVYWLGRGRGVFEPARTAEGVPAWDSSNPWQLHDLNGDGWVDLVNVGVTVVEYALATGAGRFEAARSIGKVPSQGPGVSVTFADMNGSGTTDIVWINPAATADTAWRYLELFPNGRGGLLKSIANGLGKVTRIDYEPAALHAARARDGGTPWRSRMNVGMPVVSRVAVDSSLADPTLTTEYIYRDGTWDPRERTFAGFAGGVQRELGDEHTPTLLTDSTFDTGLVQRVLRGALRTSEQRDEQGYVFSRTTSDYTSLAIGTALDGRDIQYAYKSSERVEHIEGSDGSLARTTLTEFEQDSFGNVVEERRFGEVVGDDVLVGNDEAITVRTYANNEADWLLGYVATEELQDAARQRVSARRWFYDGESFVGLPMGEVQRGDVMRQEEWVGPAADAFELDTATKYNEHGYPVETKDARGGGRIFEWSPSDPSTLKRERVQLESNVELVESAETDPRFGNLLAVVEYNGQKTRFEYDALGRLTAVYKPGDAKNTPTTRYTYAAGAPLSRVITEARVFRGEDEVERTEAIFDGLGRKRASLTRDEKERWVIAGVDLLDARGQPRRSLRPRFVSASEVESPPLHQDASGATSFRDAAGRSLRTVSELGIESRTEYQPLATRTWDGGQTDQSSEYEHTPTTQTVDGLGRVVSATQILDGSELTSRFTYDALGQLRSKTDPEGNVSRYEYDGQGRRTLVDDPDVGRRRFVYDASGNLLERHNPDGSTLKYTFDLAARPLTEDWDGDGTPEVVKTWDAHPKQRDNALYRGKLVKVQEPTGSTEHEYDKRGRITKTHLTIDGERYTSGSDYDNLDREILHTYPDGSSIRIRRNPRGQLAGYGDAVTIAYDGDGVEVERRFNTGVVQQTAYDDDRRLDEIRALAADGSTIEHLKWSFDSAGNVSAIQDLRGGVSPSDDRSEGYGYDNLYRLRTASGSWGQSEWSYSASGNLTQRISDVPGQTVSSVTYGKGAGPHAPTAIDGRALTYDVLGRLVDDGNRKYTWNSADQLMYVSASSGASVESHYDANGVRRLRIEKHADGTTSKVAFISPWSEVHGGKLVRYIVHTERRIARLSDTNGLPSASAPPGKPDEGPPRLWLTLLQSGQLFLMLGVILELLWAARESLRRALRVTVPVAAFALLAACGGDDSNDRDLEGSVRTLSDADTILITDQLGSVLAETSGTGAVNGRFASYPYGVARHDTSSETRQYAGAIRDEGVGLDSMGARFYAPDLGIWTIADPVAINNPERSTGAQFGAANPYAYANLNPVTAIDPDGEFWHIVAGAAIGAVVGGGIEAARQYVSTGKVEDWGRVGAAAAGGAVAGIVQTALPGVGTAAVVAIGGTAGAAAGMTERMVASGGKSAGTVTDIAVDAAVGAATAGVLKGASSVVRSRAAQRPAKIRSLDSEETFKRQYAEARKGGAASGGGKPLYRSMSQAEANAVRETGMLRGGRAGETYWTDSKFRSADRAQDRLSLPERPEVQMEFRLQSSPAMSRNGTRVAPDYGGRGGGREYMSTDPVEVEVINVQPYR